MSPELTQGLTALAGAAGGLGLWQVIRAIISRWFDARKDQMGDDASIREAQARRIEALEKRVDDLQRELRTAEGEASSLRAEVRWLREVCQRREPEQEVPA